MPTVDGATVAEPASRPRRPDMLARSAAELALVSALFGLDNLCRTLVSGREEVAFGHAETVHRLQELLLLPSEAAIQAAVHSEALFRAANT